MCYQITIYLQIEVEKIIKIGTMIDVVGYTHKYSEHQSIVWMK